MSASRSSSAKLSPLAFADGAEQARGRCSQHGLAHGGRAGVREHDAVLEARAELDGDRPRGAVAAVEQRAGLVEDEPAQLARAERPAAGRGRQRADPVAAATEPISAGRRRGRARRRPGARAAPRRPPQVPPLPERASRRRGAPASSRRESDHGEAPRSGLPEATRARPVLQRAGARQGLERGNAVALAGHGGDEGGRGRAGCRARPGRARRLGRGDPFRRGSNGRRAGASRCLRRSTAPDARGS